MLSILAILASILNSAVEIRSLDNLVSLLLDIIFLIGTRRFITLLNISSVEFQRVLLSKTRILFLIPKALDYLFNSRRNSPE